LFDFFAVVGNKCDLEADRKVPRELGERLAMDFGAAFFETSAKDRTNVEDALTEVTRRCMQNIAGMLPPRGKKSVYKPCILQ
jgi:GTPase SAR1 family protein